MCDLCMKHGAGGKWYLNASHYADEIVQKYDLRDFLMEQYTNFEQISFTIYGVGNIVGGSANTLLWHHVLGTYNGTHMSLYLDGVLLDSIAVTGNMSLSPQNVSIGSYADGVFGHFNGWIDEVKIWDEVLPPSDIMSDMDPNVSVEAGRKLATLWGKIRESE